MVKDEGRQPRRAWAGLGVVVVGLVAMYSSIAVTEGGIHRALAVVLLLIMLLGGASLTLLLRKSRPANWQANDVLRMRARVAFEVPMRAVLVLAVILGILFAASVPAEISAPGPASTTGVLAALAMALCSLFAVPGLARMLVGRLAWITLELGPRLVYRGWWRSADLAWDVIDSIKPHPTAALDIVIRYGRGEELLLHASMFPGARGQLLDEMRRRRALSGSR